MNSAIASAVACMASHPRDWSLDYRDAWLWGILVGWDEALDFVAVRHGWSENEKQRLLSFHRCLTIASTATAAPVEPAANNEEER